jgi:hypothetical protein
MYKLSPEYIYLMVKRGDGIIAPNKPKQKRVFDGMFGYIDPQDWKGSVVLSDFYLSEMYAVRVPRSWKPDVKKLVLPRIPLILEKNWRYSRAFLDAQQIAPHTGVPDFLSKVYQHVTIPVIDGTDWLKSYMKDTKEININRNLIPDVGQITTGTYTIGPVGANYPTWGGAGGGFAALGNLTGDLTFNQIGAVTETATALMTENLAGNTFTCTSDTPPRGDPTGGHLISWNFDNQLFNFQQEGPGTTVIQYLYTRTVFAITAGFSSMVWSTHNTDFVARIHDCMIDHNGQRGLGITIADNTLTNGEIYNNVIWGGSGTTNDSLGIQIFNAGAGWTLENNTIRDFRWCYDLNNIATTASNNVGTDSDTADFRNIGNSTGTNNASGDGSAADGGWNVGNGNLINVVPANCYRSLIDTDADF